MGTRQPQDRVDPDRRAFLDTFAKAAVVAPPAITMLLSTSMASAAIAASTGGSGAIGGGGGGGDPGGGGDTGGNLPRPKPTKPPHVPKHDHFHRAHLPHHR